MRRKILIVDDEKELLRAIQVRLTSNNYAVSFAHDGVQGLEKAQKDKPDLILLDVVMPNMDGLQMLNKLKQTRETKVIPVIMLTARSQVDDVSKAIQLGAADYIVKPFEAKIMLEKIRKIIN